MFFEDKSAWVVVEGGADFENDAVFFGEFDGARLHDFGARGSHFEHFVVGNFGEFACIFHDARVAGVHAIDVGEDLADVGFGGGGDGDGGEVGAAAAEGVDHAFWGDALEACDDESFALSEEFVHEGGVDVEDATAGMGAGGLDARLATGDGYGVDAEVLECHGDEGDGLLLAGGYEDVELAFRGEFGELVGHFDEAIGDAGHG